MQGGSSYIWYFNLRQEWPIKSHSATQPFGGAHSGGMVKGLEKDKRVHPLLGRVGARERQAGHGFVPLNRDGSIHSRRLPCQCEVAATKDSIEDLGAGGVRFPISRGLVMLAGGKFVLHGFVSALRNP